MWMRPQGVQPLTYGSRYTWRSRILSQKNHLSQFLTGIWAICGIVYLFNMEDKCGFSRQFLRICHLFGACIIIPFIFDIHSTFYLVGFLGIAIISNDCHIGVCFYVLSRLVEEIINE